MTRSEVTKGGITFGNEMVGSGSGVASKQTTGSSSTMERVGVNDTVDITFGSKMSGASGGGVSSQNAGSSGTMQRSEVQKSGITFGADAGGTAAAPAATKVMAKVLFDFAGEGAGDLGLKEGTIVIVTDSLSDPGGWWKGQDTSGKVGSFPFNYVELI